MKKLSIGSWAFLFNQDQPTNDFHALVHKLQHLGYQGVELGGFAPHPNPESHDTQEKRQKLRKMVVDHRLDFSALAADLWSQKLWSVEDPSTFLGAFEKNAIFAEDLGIKTIRVDTVEPITRVKEVGIEPKLLFDRCVNAFDKCSKIAAQHGVTICWEFEPGFPINKPSEIIGLIDAVRGLGNGNFGALYDTCHAHMCAAVGANQIGEKETLSGGALELLQKLKGKITHLHFIDSDGTLNDHNTSTHAPFGTGVLNFDQLIPELMTCGVPNDWWCVDLCFWPDAWTVTADSKRFLDKLRHKYVA
ncbi:MAG TPA: sugar phosphate isomerase/epimerase family protein [Gemmataceae bacterium]|nr:sugar phosphate isomerase/epimerase family protein [Gemmataceae bacterium]